MKNRHYGICRIDNEQSRTHAWHVVLQRRNKIYRKYFSDGVYGGKTKALRAAKAYRDQIIKKYRPMTKRQFINIKRRNNSSGVVGVSRCSYVDYRDGKETYRWYWMASWATALGKSARVKFSIEKYGDDVAFKKACDARKRAVKQQDGYFLPIQDKIIRGLVDS